MRWWWALLLGALTVEATVCGLSHRSELALDLGPVTQALVLGQLLTAAAAAVGITVVLGGDNRQETAAWRRTAERPGG